MTVQIDHVCERQHEGRERWELLRSRLAVVRALSLLFLTAANLIRLISQGMRREQHAICNNPIPHHVVQARLGTMRVYFLGLLHVAHALDDFEPLSHFARQFGLVKFLELVAPLDVAPRVDVVVNQDRRRVLYLVEQLLGRYTAQHFRKLGVDFFTELNLLANLLVEILRRLAIAGVVEPIGAVVKSVHRGDVQNVA